MSMLVAAFVGLCLYGMIRMLNLASPSLPPSLYSKTRNSEFIQAILSSCPILREPYVPPLLWGKNGHLQTVVYAKMGRMRDPVPSGTRHTKTLQDGSTLTFDFYQPTANHHINDDYCMLVCPGFGSSSESSYIRALVNHAQSCGYRVAVLNHLGCLFSLRLTAPRIFSYGGWEEFHIMRQEVEHLYPQCKLILVGLSMGANIVLKYLGENPSHQRGIWCAISICQGYNINEAKKHLKKWENLRRAYLYTMTANQRRLIKHHSEILFAEEVRRQFGFDIKKIFSATTLEDLDLHYTCKLQGYQDVVDYYESCSCSNFIGSIEIPLILLNSEDDPIVPTPLLKYARDYSESHERAAFVTTKHGGHLGYFESGFIRPHPISWIDRFVCQVSDAVIVFTLSQGRQQIDPGAHLLTLQVKKLCNPQMLEPIADLNEMEEMDDLSIGEGAAFKSKPGTSLKKGVEDEANHEAASQRNRNGCSVEEVSACESLAQWGGESEDSKPGEAQEQSEAEPGLTGMGCEGEPGMAHGEEPGVTYACHGDEPGLIEAQLAEESGLTECDEEEAGMNRSSSSTGRATEPKELSMEDEPATASEECLLHLALPRSEPSEEKSGYQTVWECLNKSPDDQAQGASISEALTSRSEESWQAEESAVKASLEQQSGHFDDDQKPGSWHSASLVSSESTEGGKICAQGKSSQEADVEDARKEATLQSVSKPLSSEHSPGDDEDDQLQKAVREAASCEAIRQCSRLQHEDQQLKDLSGFLPRQLSQCTHGCVSGDVDQEKGVKDFAAVIAEQNGTLPAIKQSTDGAGSDPAAEVTATVSSAILNAANSQSC